MMQVFVIVPAVTPVATQVAMIAMLVLSVATQLAAIVARLAMAPRGAIAIQLAAVTPAIAIVGTDVAAVAAEVAAIVAEIATVGANIARIALHPTGSVGRKGRLRARDSRSGGGQRHRQSECNQFVAKHREILRRSVGARLRLRAVQGGRRPLKPNVKDCLY
jgi:hypothetical protein